MVRAKTIHSDKTAAEIQQEEFEEMKATEHPDLVRARAIAAEMKKSGATVQDGDKAPPAVPLPPQVDADDSFRFVLTDGREVYMKPPDLPACLGLSKVFDNMNSDIGNVTVQTRARATTVMLHVRSIGGLAVPEPQNWQQVEDFMRSLGKHWRALYDIMEALWPENGAAYWHALKNESGAETT